MNGINRPDAWLSCTLAGVRAIEDARFDEAALFWRDSCAFADHLPDDDPRRAAALNNLGLIEFIAGHRDQAMSALSTARDHWQKVETWVRQVDIPSSASSSMFHFLLAANHPDVLTRLRREKHLTICAGAAAITEAIYDQARGHNAEPDRVQKHAEAIQAAFGEDAAEAHTRVALAARLSPEKPPEKRARIVKSAEEQWRSVSKNTVVEMRPLIDAAYLTIALKPEYLGPRTRTSGLAAAKNEDIREQKWLAQYQKLFRLGSRKASILRSRRKR